MPSKSKGIKDNWIQESMTRAIDAVRSGMSVNKASQTYNIPRRNLRRYLETNKENKSVLGRKPILTVDQESKLVQRIIRLSQVGYPLTFKVLRSCVKRYAKSNNIANPFRSEKEMAGRYWLKGFSSRNPQIRPRKSQNLNPPRAQKLNPCIVKDHFIKLEGILTELDIINKPERIYNIDEKDCRLYLHHQQKVLAQKGARRVHIVGNEHGENVTIVACGKALGVAIPPLILFKGKRMKPEWKDTLPSGSDALMTSKESMTVSTVISWLDHFAKYKVAGPCLLIFDGAKCHLDYSIVEKAADFDITLYCLPSNTTHELQPMDKAVFRAFEYYWDDDVLKFLSVNKEHSITKYQFGTIFSIMSRFSATGIYPLNKDAIPEVAFAPSTVTNRDLNNVETPTEVLSSQPSTSGLQKKHLKRRRESSDSDSSESEVTLHDENATDESDEDNYSDFNDERNVSFQDMLSTPDETFTKRKSARTPALNCRAQIVKKNLFHKEAKEKPTIQKKETKDPKESWFCKACGEDRIADMRLCSSCKLYVHEECVGLTSKDKLAVFLCLDCEKD